MSFCSRELLQLYGIKGVTLVFFSCRFWLVDYQDVTEVTEMANSLYKELCNVPFMSRFVVFGKRHEHREARLRVFCMTDDKIDKTLETQQYFTEVARSRDIEVSWQNINKNRN